MSQLKLDFISDSSHGWLKVERRLLSLDTMKKISVFSYQDEEFVYLEEDRDAALFINQWTTGNGKGSITYNDTCEDGDSFIRGLGSYKI